MRFLIDQRSRLREAATDILDIVEDGYGFMRRRGLMPSPDDIYVSSSHVRRFGLRAGDRVAGYMPNMIETAVAMLASCIRFAQTREPLEAGFFWSLVLLLAFPEGFLAGTIVTALTVFYPQIMRTYDDDRYLGPRDPGDGDG